MKNLQVFFRKNLSIIVLGLFLVSILVFSIQTLSTDSSQPYPENAQNGSTLNSTVVTTISPIYPEIRQVIYINGSNFGSNPQVESVATGGVDTVTSNTTPYMVIRDHGGGPDYWGAGRVTSTNFDAIGIIIDKWNTTQIILGGFGNGLSIVTGEKYVIQAEDPLEIVVWGPNGSSPSYYNLTVSPLHSYTNITSNSGGNGFVVSYVTFKTGFDSGWLWAVILLLVAVAAEFPRISEHPVSFIITVSALVVILAIYFVIR